MTHKYLHKIYEGFESVDYNLDSVKELLNEIIEVNEVFGALRHHNMNVKDFYYSLFELEIKIRALRDKLENG